MPIRKRFGQNFLIDANIIDRILSAINPKSADAVIEIGPGQGALTERLLATGCKLAVIEIDRDLAAGLGQRYPALQLIVGDALKFDFSSLTSEGCRIVGNLPYNISTPLLFRLFDVPGITDMHFMLQHEVVERMTARPASGTYGRLSVMCQYHCEPRRLFTVSPDAFMPRPKVTSAFVRLVPRPFVPAAIHRPTLAALVTQAFSQRRKTIRNALKPFLAEHEFNALALDPKARPENLSVSDFVNCANFVSQRSGATV